MTSEWRKNLNIFFIPYIENRLLPKSIRNAAYRHIPSRKKDRRYSAWLIVGSKRCAKVFIFYELTKRIFFLFENIFLNKTRRFCAAIFTDRQFGIGAMVIKVLQLRINLNEPSTAITTAVRSARCSSQLPPHQNIELENGDRKYFGISSRVRNEGK